MAIVGLEDGVKGPHAWGFGREEAGTQVLPGSLQEEMAALRKP